MPFTINTTTLLLEGRKGDSASLTFNFNQDMTGYTVSFYIKSNPTATTALVEKNYSDVVGSSVTVDLLPADTDVLASKPNGYNTYYWGLRVNQGDTFAQTIIPTGTNQLPQVHIYPEVGE